MEERKSHRVEITSAIGILMIGIAIVYVINWLIAGTGQIQEEGYGLFSWEPEIAERKDDWEMLFECMEKSDSGSLYQQFSKEAFKEEITGEFVKELKKRNKHVYALAGAPEWAYETDGKHIVKWLKRVAVFNLERGKDERIDGLMIDVEPYLLEEWEQKGEARQKLMEGYLEGICEGYEYAKEHGISYLVCIPSFYDATNQEILEILIARGCDGVAVMNYDRTDEEGQIRREVELAKKYEKRIINIYELQKAGKHDLKQINTYAQEGLEALWRSSESLQQAFSYDKLQFAYHYYKPLREMLAE